jgi:hypothetical protein
MKWFFLPGMGATDAMYNGLKHKLGFKVNFLNWPEYHGEKTYADVARRVMKENDISADDVVGGSSLGGMVALENRKNRVTHLKAPRQAKKPTHDEKTEFSRRCFLPLSISSPMPQFHSVSVSVPHCTSHPSGLRPR